MEDIELKAKLVNGRLVIESIDEQSSEELAKWIKENSNHFNRYLDMEILAH